ncbi:synaptotagmin-like protein 2 isoform X2 [Denticeps clupeoides]|uniref:synaptotagmin-like protein 2 isoform X2 n=1 Tax=Denticeps clupeoides TaxID=299321 RepID=UPI0010A3EC06|nr:synaptotagmin-like protein 2 isoform X2 [Denticeps clupeoides]
MYSSHESLLENRAHAPRLPPPKGILKLTSSYSSCDSLPVRRNSGQLLDPLSPPDSPSSLFSSGDWLERKQVRFSSVVTGINNVVDDDDDNEAGDHDSFLPSEDSSNGFIHEDDNDRLTEENEVALDCPVAAHFSPGSLFCDNGPADREDVKSGERENSRGGSDMKIPDELSAGAFNDQHENHHADPPIIQVSDVHGAVSGRGNIEDASPARRAMKKLSPRPLSLSKSLEDITKVPALSATPISPTSTFLNPEQMKMMSTSVPSSLQEQSNGRFPPENSFHADRQKAMNSSQTNISCSSGMASMSSASGSVMSIYMGDYGNVEVRGTIRFAMNYVEKIGEFHICVVQCKDLAVAEPKRNRSDPYVKCYLMPDKTKLGKRKTSVKKKTLNPTYNEILKYKIAMETLKTQTLNLSVWHNDTFGRNSFLGEVDIDLSKWSFSNTQMKDFVLKARPAAHFKPTDHRGEVRVALRFLPGVSQSKSLPKMGEIQIWVKECRNLPAVRGVIDPFIKCAVLPDTSRKSRQKTRVVKKSANPAFNHTMVYNGFGAEDLQETCVELTVWDHDRLNNHFLGGLRLGLGTGKSYGSDVDWMDSNPDERTMWDRMMESPNEWVEDVLPLRMLMMARSMSK